MTTKSLKPKTQDFGFFRIETTMTSMLLAKFLSWLGFAAVCTLFLGFVKLVNDRHMTSALYLAALVMFAVTYSMVIGPAIRHFLMPSYKRWLAPRVEAFGKTRSGKLIQVAFFPLILVLSKLKFFALLISKLKYVTTLFTMVISMGAYGLAWGWAFGIGFVLLILVHELGHALELRRQGIRAGLPVFIPFIGALIAMKEMPKNALNEAKVGLAGPVLGSLGTLALLPLALNESGNFWKALMFTGFMINIFNLVPMSPLDGGRAMAAVHPYLQVVGIVMMVAMVFMLANPFLIIFAIIGGIDAWSRLESYQADKWAGRDSYYRTAKGARVAIASLYILLVAGLALSMHFTYVPMDQIIS